MGILPCWCLNLGIGGGVFCADQCVCPFLFFLFSLEVCFSTHLDIWFPGRVYYNSLLGTWYDYGYQTGHPTDVRLGYLFLLITWCLSHLPLLGTSLNPWRRPGRKFPGPPPPQESRRYSKQLKLQIKWPRPTRQRWFTRVTFCPFTIPWLFVS